MLAGNRASTRFLQPKPRWRYCVTVDREELARILPPDLSLTMTSEPKEPVSPNKPAVSDQPLQPTVKPPRKRRRWPIVVGALVAAVLLFIGIPWLIRAFNTVSTDDAYVNG